LCVAIKTAVKRHDRHTGQRAYSSQLLRRAANLGCARQETQHGAARRRQLRHDGRLQRDPGRVADGQRVLPAWHVDDRAAAEVLRHAPGIQRRRHDDQTQIVARAPRLPCQREPEIGMDAALVKLVDHDGPHVMHERILLQTRGEHAFRGQNQLRLRAQAAIESDVPSHLAAKRPALFLRDPVRDRSRGHAPGLQHQDAARRHQRRRDARRLAGARRGRNDSGARVIHGAHDLGHVRVDRQRLHETSIRPRSYYNLSVSLNESLSGAIVMAPMTKGSNLPYRRLCIELGARV
jgi:hypothetical protein